MSRRTSSPYVIRGSVNGRPLAVEIGMDFDPGEPSPSYTPEYDYDAEPCRGCGRTDCGERCAEFRAWLTVAFLGRDAAHGGDADARP